LAIGPERFDWLWQELKDRPNAAMDVIALFSAYLGKSDDTIHLGDKPRQLPIEDIEITIYDLP
jgi:hypothetical protein